MCLSPPWGCPTIASIANRFWGASNFPRIPTFTWSWARKVRLEVHFSVLPANFWKCFFLIPCLCSFFRTSSCVQRFLVRLRNQVLVGQEMDCVRYALVCSVSRWWVVHCSLLLLSSSIYVRSSNLCEQLYACQCFLYYILQDDISSFYHCYSSCISTGEAFELFSEAKGAHGATIVALHYSVFI